MRTKPRLSSRFCLFCSAKQAKTSLVRRLRTSNSVFWGGGGGRVRAAIFVVAFDGTEMSGGVNGAAGLIIRSGVRKQRHSSHIAGQRELHPPPCARWPGTLGSWLAGHCLWVLVWTGACYWHGAGGLCLIHHHRGSARAASESPSGAIGGNTTPVVLMSNYAGS